VADLSVNLNKIALLRNSRGGNFPDVIEHAQSCIRAGCQGITLHPRPDQRHVRPVDAYGIAELLQDNASFELNLEGNPFAEAEDNYPGFVSLVLQCRPDQCTLVPDSRHQLTSDHGFDLKIGGERLTPLIDQLHEAGIRVSLFMDPNPEQIELAAKVGADRIELYTGPFAEAYADSPEAAARIFSRHTEAANCAFELGLGVNAGHDLNLQNLQLYRQLPHLAEVSIGHALIVDAIAMGLEQTVRAYLAALET
jgi:pyridoxine 5-phosphate synthase